MNIIDDSYESISKCLNLDPCVSYDADWSAAPDFLRLLIDHCLESQPDVIVECSSGVTSVILARCCQLNGVGHVYSMESGQDYAFATSAQIRQFGLEAYSDVIHAPLQNVLMGQQAFNWYPLDGIDVCNVDMLVIDGPSGFIQKNSRYPAIPMLYQRLSADCKIFLDDAARPDEKEITALWLNEFPDLEHCFVDNERGCSIFNVKS